VLILSNGTKYLLIRSSLFYFFNFFTIPSEQHSEFTRLTLDSVV